MQELNFENGNVPVATVAKVLKMDCQTVRLLLQQGLVDWGFAFKPKGSRHFSYIIYAKKFYESTGYLYKGGVGE